MLYEAVQQIKNRRKKYEETDVASQEKLGAQKPSELEWKERDQKG